MTGFTQKVIATLDAGRALTTTLLNQLWDNTTHAWERLNILDASIAEAFAGALRNGSFESGTTGWTITQFAGGTVAIDTVNDLDGAQALAFTSTVLLNGGGDAVGDEYMPVTGGSTHATYATVRASVANLSGKLEIHWYNDAKALISTEVEYTSNNIPTTITQVGGTANAPTNARWKRIRVTGNLPGSVAPVTVGTVYWDGIKSSVATGLLRYTRITASNAAWAKLPETKTIVVEVCGGGSGGGGGVLGSAAGGGGAGGEGALPVKGTLAATSATYSVTIGGGGAGAISGVGNVGGVGSNSSFDAIVGPGSKLGGRNLVSAGVKAIQPAGGGGGGVGTNAGDAGANGGGAGQIANGAGAAAGSFCNGGGGAGGSGGSVLSAPGISAAANSAAGGGGGGAGSTSASDGGAGGSGFVDVWEYA